MTDTTIGYDLAKALNNIPVLRYLKDPVTTIEELWLKYPQGGEYGWYAFVVSKQTFVWWNTEESDWEFLSKGDLQTMLGVDPSLLAEGDTPVWDGAAFVVRKLSDSVNLETKSNLTIGLKDSNYNGFICDSLSKLKTLIAANVKGKYVINSDIDLDEDIVIPPETTLEFRQSGIYPQGHKITFQNTNIIADNHIFKGLLGTINEENLGNEYSINSPFFPSFTFAGKLANDQIQASWFGAKGDGVITDNILQTGYTDNTLALYAAFYASQMFGGKIVKLDDGVFVVDYRIHVNHSHTGIVGNGFKTMLMDGYNNLMSPDVIQFGTTTYINEVWDPSKWPTKTLDGSRDLTADELSRINIEDITIRNIKFSNLTGYNDLKSPDYGGNLEKYTAYSNRWYANTNRRNHAIGIRSCKNIKIKDIYLWKVINVGIEIRDCYNVTFQNSFFSYMRSLKYAAGGGLHGGNMIDIMPPPTGTIPFEYTDNFDLGHILLDNLHVIGSELNLNAASQKMFIPAVYGDQVNECNVGIQASTGLSTGTYYNIKNDHNYSVIITNCSIRFAKNGIMLEGLSYNGSSGSILDCTVMDCLRGVWLHPATLSISQNYGVRSKNIIIKGNLFKRIVERGITGSVSYANISDNIFDEFAILPDDALLSGLSDIRRVGIELRAPDFQGLYNTYNVQEFGNIVIKNNIFRKIDYLIDDADGNTVNKAAKFIYIQGYESGTNKYRNIQIEGNILESNNIRLSTSISMGVIYITGGVSNVTIKNNILHNLANHGIFVLNDGDFRPEDIYIEGNSFRNLSFSGLKHNAVYLRACGDNINVINNDIHDCQYIARVEASSTSFGNMVIRDNRWENLDLADGHSIELTGYTITRHKFAFERNYGRNFSSMGIDSLPATLFVRGEKIENISTESALNNISYYRNINAGTPGTWITHRSSNLSSGATADRPILTADDRGTKYFDTTLNITIIWNGSRWNKADGSQADTLTAGTFAEKPVASNIYLGYKYFCSDKQTIEGATDGIEINHKGSDVWVDALGRIVS